MKALLEDGVQEYHNTNHEDSSSVWRRRDGIGEAERQFTANLRCHGVVDMGQERFDVNNSIRYIYPEVHVPSHRKVHIIADWSMGLTG